MMVHETARDIKKLWLAIKLSICTLYVLSICTSKKVKTMVWEPIEGFNLEPKFLTWTPSKP
jgi:hypothetical protein